MFSFKVGRTTEKHMEVLEINSFPFTEDDVKANYKRLVKERHVDAGGSNEEYSEINVARDYLMNLCTTDGMITKEIRDTLAGDSDSDLFQLTETRTCRRCSGDGTITAKVEKECRTCEGTGHHYTKCRACNGTGDFYLKKSGRKVKCRKCSGTGTFINKRGICPSCKGSGSYREYAEITCHVCGGKGKVKVKLNPFNPVIAKASVMI